MNIPNENVTKVPENNFELEDEHILTAVINSTENKTVISTQEKSSNQTEKENKRKLSNSSFVESKTAR